MKLVTLLLTVLLTFLPSITSAEKMTEAAYVTSHCQGQIEYVLPDKTRVDCLTDTHAIEYDFSYKWAEAIGQSLYYSAMTGKRAGVVLLVKVSHKGRYLTRLYKVVGMIPCKPNQCPAIDIWTIYY